MGASWRVLLVIITLSMVMLSLVDQRVKVRNLEEEIRKNRRLKDRIQTEISELRIQKFHLESSDRISSIAKRDLMMVFPEGAMKRIF